MQTSQLPDCQLSFSEGKATCAVCGSAYSWPGGKLRAKCFGPAVGVEEQKSVDLVRDAGPVPFLTRLKNFATATAKHVAAGMPMASDEEILRRHDICQTCEFFKNNSCSKCGCPIYRDKKFVSKLAWADQSCPVGKWGPQETAKGQ